MKVEIGTDIEKISRFHKLKSNLKFVNLVYTDGEQRYCFSKNKPEEHLAARFAAKESIIKSYFSLTGKFLNFKDIEIINGCFGDKFDTILQVAVEC
jgi:holo-[acyl-carrier protein] synthase